MALVLLLAACGLQNLPIVGSPTPEQPRDVRVVVVDAASGAPLPNAAVEGGARSASTSTDGAVTVTAMRGATLSIAAADHASTTATVPVDGDLTVRLRANVLTGKVTDQQGAPLAGVKVFVDGQPTVVRTDSSGAYRLGGVPEAGTIVYKMAGYRLAEAAIAGATRLDVRMQPFTAHALYAPASVFEGTGRLDAMLRTIAATEVNAMVIDVKEGQGNLYYATDLPEARAAGAVMAQPLLHLDTLLPVLKARGIYTIARMVVMKDDTLPKARPALAVQNARTGRPWTDYKGNTWLDPYEPGVAEYIAAIARDLASKGFDEVQLDYVRFFSDGDYNTADTNLPNTQSFRLPAIRRLFRLVSETLAPTRTFFGADVFPISFIADDDQGIGQRPEVIMPYVDYFDPMVYPSHYGPYTFGYAVPNNYPYQIINRSLQLMNRESAGLPMRIRPWIQDFTLPGMRAYTAADVRAEMKALSDNHATGWMIWNAAARFTAAALGPPQPGEAAGVMKVTEPSASAPASASATASPSEAVAASSGP